MAIVTAILILTFCLVVHEMGHYLASTAFGIPTEVFSIGIGPRLLKLFTWKGTEFRIALLPIGASVRPVKQLHEIPVAQRIVIVVAGPAMNMIAAGVFLYLYTVNITVGYPSPGFYVATFFQSQWRVIVATVEYFPMFLSILIGTGDMTDVVGPVGIVTALASVSGTMLISYIANINMSLAIFNLLPFPPLDGGHLVVALIEKVLQKFGKDNQGETVQKWATIVGFALILNLMFKSWGTDIGHLFNR